MSSNPSTLGLKSLEIKSRTKRWLELNPTLPQRVNHLTDVYGKLYGKEREELKESNLLLACAPGRAEILGNHTDYNQGYTLSANITQNLLILGAQRKDNIVQVASLNQEARIVRFTTESVESIIEQRAKHGTENAWANYVKGVIWSFKKRGLPTPGFNAVIQSTIPLGAGVSSSAAIELATAQLVSRLGGINISLEDLITICKDAENKYVGAPCGYLDQGTIVLADSGWLEMDYRPVGNRQFTFKKTGMDLAKLGYTLVVGYDPGSKHELVDGKYAIRQSTCRNSVPIIQELLPSKKIKALRDVSVEDFSSIKDQFYRQAGETATNFVKHVVDENERVIQGVGALQKEDISRFGELMTASGESAIKLYNLAEGAPELRFVYKTVVSNQRAWGVKGIRNMGGGFNATTLALLTTTDVDRYQNALGSLYSQKYHRLYNFLNFVPAPSACMLSPSEIANKDYV